MLTNNNLLTQNCYKTETEVKQVVGKRRNKSDTYILCPVESHGRVDGLYTLRSAQEEAFARRMPR